MTAEKQLTAIEWLTTKLQSFNVIKEEHYELLCQLELVAKEMEKEQMIKFAKMHVKTALKAVENEMILQASSVKHWYLPQNIK